MTEIHRILMTTRQNIPMGRRFASLLADLAFRFWRSVFTCGHEIAGLPEGKCFCRRCGRPVVVRWATLRCRGCGIRRNGRYHLRRAVPMERFCSRCGDAAFRVEYPDNPSFFQLEKALLCIQEEADYLAAASWVTRTVAWLEKATPAAPARRRLPPPAG